jgi:molybdopterin converting factor small subunit
VSDESPAGVENANDVTRADVARVTVRYWAAARAAAGVESDVVEASTLAGALDAVRRLRPDDRRFADVVGICSVLVGEVPVGARPHAEVALSPGDVVELLPPFAGG